MPRNPVARFEHAEPVAILQKINANELDPLELSITARRAVVAELHIRGWSCAKIARVLKYNRVTIWRDIKALRVEMGQRTTDLDVRRLAGEHIERAEHLAAKLQEDKRWSEAWAVYRDLISDLQSLGMVVKQPQTVNIVATPQALEKLPDHELAEQTQKILDVEFELASEFEGEAAPQGDGAPAEGEAPG